MNYYVNITTGELIETKETLSPFRFPSYNVEGWSNLNEFEYMVMTFVRGYGFVEGVKAEMDNNKENK